VKIARTLPPVGYRVHAASLLTAAAGLIRHDRYREQILQPDFARAFDRRTVFAVSSGKAALALTLRALAQLTGRRKVIIPAYTCYSVPSAIVKAGLDVVPCDLAEGSFDYDHTRLVPLLRADVLCVVSVHLFGIPADTPRLAQLCRGTGIFVVEDAAQSFGGGSQGRKLGTIGDVGIFSFGRGKNITCGSGGLIVTASEPIAAALGAVTGGLRSSSFAGDVASFVTLTLLSWFILPRLYWFPAGLPFLRLGETIFHDDFPIRWMSEFEARLLRDWREQLSVLEGHRRLNAEHYFANINVLAEGVHGLPQPARLHRGVPFLRLPVILSKRSDRERLVFEQDGKTLGISTMYPGSVAAIRQLAGRLGDSSYPRAEAIAQQLVTLPTHPLVTPSDRERICAVVNQCSGRDGEARMAS